MLYILYHIIKYHIIYHMIPNAKFAYLLSSCDDVIDELMKLMVSQYVDSKTVSTRHYFTLFINFKESNSIKQFDIKDLYCKFASSCDNILLDVLQSHNNTILSQIDMININKNLVNSNIILSTYQLVSLFSIATLIKLYKGISKYLFIPIILNYGINKYLLHQTALIIDISQKHLKFIYYEPYGLYEKYGKSYKSCMGQLFKCFDGFIGDSISYQTYHDMFDIAGIGIQKLILDSNNANIGEFNTEMNSLIDSVNINFPNTIQFDQRSYMINNEELSDKTVYILNILEKIDSLDISKITNIQKKNYFKCLNKALKLFYYFSSKTCVSITIVEMDNFFKVSSEYNHDFDLIKSNIIKYNLSYKSLRYPNSVIMDNIYKMINLFKNSDKLKEIINTDQPLSEFCKKITHV
jgi:hypothetical protein